MRKKYVAPKSNLIKWATLSEYIYTTWTPQKPIKLTRDEKEKVTLFPSNYQTLAPFSSRATVWI